MWGESRSSSWFFFYKSEYERFHFRQKSIYQRESVIIEKRLEIYLKV